MPRELDWTALEVGAQSSEFPTDASAFVVDPDAAPSNRLTVTARSFEEEGIDVEAATDADGVELASPSFGPNVVRFERGAPVPSEIAERVWSSFSDQIVALDEDGKPL